MLKKAQDYFSGIKPVFIDGFLYLWIAMLTSIAAFFGSDDAEKYVGPQLLFWLKGIITTISAGVVSIKMFRSTAFADHLEEKKRVSGETEFIKRD